MDLIALVSRLPIPGMARCRIPRDLASVTSVGPEDHPRDAGLTLAGVDKLWRSVEALYTTGAHPAIQICIRRQGRVVLHRSLGHARGNAPDDAPGAERVLVTTETPFDIFSASKAVTAMLIHKLDEEHVLHLEDRVADFIPEFGRHGKERITIRHLLSHRAGIPNLPPDAFDLDLLAHPERVLEILCEARPRTRPGRLCDTRPGRSARNPGRSTRRHPVRASPCGRPRAAETPSGDPAGTGTTRRGRHLGHGPVGP